MDADVAFGQHGNAAHPLWAELVRMDMQQGRAAGFDTVAKGLLNPVFFIQPRAIDHFDDQVSPGKDLAIAPDEMIFTVRRQQRLFIGAAVVIVIGNHGQITTNVSRVFRMGGACPQVHPQLEEVCMVVHCNASPTSRYGTQ